MTDLEVSKKLQLKDAHKPPLLLSVHVQTLPHSIVLEILVLQVLLPPSLNLAAHGTPAPRPRSKQRSRRGIYEVAKSATPRSLSPSLLFMGSASHAHQDQDDSQVHVSDNTDPWTATIPVSGLPVIIKLDSGTVSSIISQITFLKLNRQITLSPARLRLQGPSGNDLPFLGLFIAHTNFHG